MRKRISSGFGIDVNAYAIKDQLLMVTVVIVLTHMYEVIEPNNATI
jgi:hypothetical protein